MVYKNSNSHFSFFFKFVCLFDCFDTFVLFNRSSHWWNLRQSVQLLLFWIAWRNEPIFEQDRKLFLKKKTENKPLLIGHFATIIFNRKPPGRKFQQEKTKLSFKMPKILTTLWSSCSTSKVFFFLVSFWSHLEDKKKSYFYQNIFFQTTTDEVQVQMETEFKKALENSVQVISPAFAKMKEQLIEKLFQVVQGVKKKKKTFSLICWSCGCVVFFFFIDLLKL